MITEPFDYPVLQEGKIREATTIVEFSDPSIPHGLIMSRKLVPSEEQKKWRRIIEQMRADGTLHNIYEKYFDAGVANAMINY
jgi:polar amino acid transport system substrate-binding protein